MVRHIIIMSSSYSEGRRIAMDFCGKNLTSEKIYKALTYIKRHCGEGVSLSTHFIDTDSASWDSVVKADSFFKSVYNVNNLRIFTSLIKQDLTLKGVDIAKYILSKKEYSHLELEKLTYFCYAEYLCRTKKQLFKDKIYAYKYGPVVESVYKYYKNIDCFDDLIDLYSEEDKDSNIMCEPLPIKSKIIFTENGVEKLKIMDNTLEKYGNFSAGELIGKTHLLGSPWSRTIQSGIISDENILKYHIVEM